MTRCDYEKHEFILQNLKLAQKIARRYKRKLSHISLEEIESAAYLGLVQAAESFDFSKSTEFIKFAIFRIFGAIRDYLRELAWGPRSKFFVHDMAINLDDLTIKTDDIFPNELFEKIIECLPKKNKLAMKKYYVDCEKLFEIAVALDVNESRVSQILSESRKMLKETWLLFEQELYEAAA
jgi:RNA polymerase sigma factor (sigma-70 family)